MAFYKQVKKILFSPGFYRKGLVTTVFRLEDTSACKVIFFLENSTVIRVGPQEEETRMWLLTPVLVSKGVN